MHPAAAARHCALPAMLLPAVVTAVETIPWPIGTAFSPCALPAAAAPAAAAALQAGPCLVVLRLHPGLCPFCLKGMPGAYCLALLTGCLLAGLHAGYISRTVTPATSSDSLQRSRLLYVVSYTGHLSGAQQNKISMCTH